MDRPLNVFVCARERVAREDGWPGAKARLEERPPLKMRSKLVVRSPYDCRSNVRAMALVEGTHP